MTSLGRTVVALALLAGMVALLAIGKASESAVFGPIGVIVGYVFGDRNGEKRTAAAVVQVAATHGSEAAVVDAVRQSVPPSAVTKLDTDPPTSG